MLAILITAVAGLLILAEQTDQKSKKKVIKQLSGAWAQYGPPMNISWMRTASPVVYGTFRILPAGKTPMFNLSHGNCALFRPLFVAPYIGSKGEWLPLQKTSLLISECTADYDGDGKDEVAIAYLGSAWTRKLLYVGDPSAARAYVQSFWFPTPKLPSLSVYYAASGDFDGDKDPDILVSLVAQTALATSSHFAFLQCDRVNGAGKPPLKRIY